MSRGRGREELNVTSRLLTIIYTEMQSRRRRLRLEANT